MQPFWRDLGRYIQARWALVALIAVGWLLRRHAGNDVPLDLITFGLAGLMAIILLLGWNQLVVAPGSGIRFAFLAVMLLLFLSPVIMIALPFLLLFFVVDLFFIAPHRRLN